MEYRTYNLRSLGRNRPPSLSLMVDDSGYYVGQFEQPHNIDAFFFIRNPNFNYQNTVYSQVPMGHNDG